MISMLQIFRFWTDHISAVALALLMDQKYAWLELGDKFVAMPTGVSVKVKMKSTQQQPIELNNYV
jgi:hypothetical protein